MNPPDLIISPIARNDLKVIYQYSLRKWGETQSSTYLDAIKTQFWNLTEHPEIGIVREELSPYMRSFSIESHVVFYRLRTEHIEIVRVLHSRQDPQHHFCSQNFKKYFSQV